MIAGIVASGIAGAPLVDRSILRVIGDGAGAAFIDRSPSLRTLTAVGNAANSSTVVGSGAHSIALDGSGDYVTAPDSADWNRADSMTWEALVYLDVASFTLSRYFTIFGQSVSGTDCFELAVFCDDTAHALVQALDKSTGGIAYSLLSTSIILPRTVHHIALVTNGVDTLVRLKIDGVDVGTITPTVASIDLTSALQIGAWSDNGSYLAARDFLGFLKVRVSPYARYGRATFTPPTDFDGNDGAAVVTSAWNPSDKGASVTLRNSNQIASMNASTNSVRGAQGRSSGHYQFEVEIGGPDVTQLVGLSNASASLSSYPGSDANGWSFYVNGPLKFNGGSSTAYGSGTGTPGDIIGVEYNAGAITFWRNGVSQGSNAFTGVSGTLFPMVGNGSGSGGPRTFILNTGQRPFDYPISGAAAWG